MDSVDLIIGMEFPYDQNLLERLLAEFKWEFQPGKIHPAMTDDCPYPEHEVAAEGNLQIGQYENAAASCPHHCYPDSRPAFMRWNNEKNYIHLATSIWSSKFSRAIKVFRDFLNPYWPGDKTLALHEEADLAPVKQIKEEDKMMIFELKKANVSVEDVEGDELIQAVTDETGARVGTISIYKDGGVVLESEVHDSQGFAVFDRLQDFFGNVVKWYNAENKQQGEQNEKEK